MALISRFPGALQLGAFQSGAFQVDLARVDAAGDIATASEIAYLERRRRVDAYLAERERRTELRRLRHLDRQIDKYLAERSGAVGEVDEADLSPNARALLRHAVSSVQPQTTNKGAGRTELNSLPPLPPRRPSRHRSAKSISLLSAFGTRQSGRQQQAMADIMTFQLGPPRMTPDQLMAALAQGTAQMQRLRGY
jgi:hypothetical protein